MLLILTADLTSQAAAQPSGPAWQPGLAEISSTSEVARLYSNAPTAPGVTPAGGHAETQLQDAHDAIADQLPVSRELVSNSIMGILKLCFSVASSSWWSLMVGPTLVQHLLNPMSTGGST